MPVTKAVVIGGSNGIGLALSRALSDRGAGVHILDIAEPDRNIISENECEYSRFDMRRPDMDFIAGLAEDSSINALIITAGIGRVSEFENFTLPEIDKTLTVNYSAYRGWSFLIQRGCFAVFCQSLTSSPKALISCVPQVFFLLSNIMLRAA